MVIETSGNIVQASYTTFTLSWRDCKCGYYCTGRVFLEIDGLKYETASGSAAKWSKSHVNTSFLSEVIQGFLPHQLSVNVI